MRMSCELIETGRYDSYREILAEADACKDELSVLRKKHIDRIQHMTDNTLMQISLVYLNVLQESQEFLSVMRHQLRAAKKFMESKKTLTSCHETTFWYICCMMTDDSG